MSQLQLRRMIRRIVMGCLVLLAAGRAGADQITIGINGGLLDMLPNDGRLVLSGDRGFTFSSHVDIAGGVFQPAAECFDACMPGSSLSLRGSWLGNDLVGNATLDGVTYRADGADAASLGVEFDGMATLPPIADSATVVAPFTFSGEFFLPGPGGIALTVALEGAGTATLSLVRDDSRPNSWLLREARYLFGSPSGVGFAAPGGDNRRAVIAAPDVARRQDKLQARSGNSTATR